MIKNLVYVVILLLGFPIGLYLSKVCKDEIKNWRKRFLIISILALILIVGISFTDFIYKFLTILSLFFMIIFFLTIIWKSYRGKK